MMQQGNYASVENDLNISFQRKKSSMGTQNRTIIIIVY